MVDTVIKVEKDPIKQAVSTLKQSTQAVESSFPEEMEGKNQLDLLKQLMELNETYADILKSYQTLLLQHIQITEDSVASFIEMDETLANYLSFLE
ncbi:YwqI/YxiC family protein [Lentibacillus sp. N15]|uniref:YwqI/YxiC family protein n=1 Tax=Lentibacillus songyuanensis TaxID=3136161 RepID=UPI0031B9B109